MNLTDDEDRDNVKITYELTVDVSHYQRHFTDQEKKQLRPIAEILAMLDGNAFLSMRLGGGQEWYEQYLGEAYALFISNGGLHGWAGDVSWIKESQHENDSVREAYQNWQMLKALSKGDDDADDNSRPF
jgi:hypothetical protein